MTTNYLIYKHTSPSGKSYIGQTKNYERRCKEHQCSSSECRAFSSAIAKYTWDMFTHEILAEHLTIDEANVMEHQYIVDHNTIAPYGYNLTSGGLNRVVCEETRIIIRNNSIGRKISEDVITARTTTRLLQNGGIYNTDHMKQKNKA